MKIQLKQFVCDTCGKKAKPVIEGTGYIYKRGWLYIYRFEGKSDKCIHMRTMDSHFCSKKCLMSYIEATVNGAIKEKENQKRGRFK